MMQLKKKMDLYRTIKKTGFSEISMMDIYRMFKKIVCNQISTMDKYRTFQKKGCSEIYQHPSQLKMFLTV